MSKVLQAVDSIHQVGIYCLALVPPNYLPRSALGGIHIYDTMKKLQDGTLHPANVLMCPHTCVVNLPQVGAKCSLSSFILYQLKHFSIPVARLAWLSLLS